MNIIRKYLDYRRNRTEVRHYEKIIEPREEDVLFIGSPSLEDLARSITLEDYKGEDQEVIKFWEGLRNGKE